MHHLRYTSPYYPEESIYGYEEPEDLALLCRDCHKSRHIDPAGNWWSDPEEMYWTWFSFHEEMERG